MKSEKPYIEGERIYNAYRTDKYIVFQEIHAYGENKDMLISDDTFYPRTPIRDERYEKIYGEECRFCKRKRMKVSHYTRRYVE